MVGKSRSYAAKNVPHHHDLRLSARGRFTLKQPSPSHSNAFGKFAEASRLPILRPAAPKLSLRRFKSLRRAAIGKLPTVRKSSWGSLGVSLWSFILIRAGKSGIWPLSFTSNCTWSARPVVLCRDRPDESSQFPQIFAQSPPRQSAGAPQGSCLHHQQSAEALQSSPGLRNL